MKKLLPLSLVGSAACVPAFLDLADARNVSQVSDSEMQDEYDGQNLGTFQTNFNSIAAKSNGVPVGTVISWPIASMPEDAENWLECDGKPVPSNYELAKIMTHTPDYRGMFLRGNGGKSAALGQQQEQGTYVPNTSITLSGEIGETAALKTTTSQYFYGYSVSVVTGYHINDETYCYYDNWSQTCTSILTKFLRPQNTSKTYTVTINSGSGETRPVNKSVRYLIRAQ